MPTKKEESAIVIAEKEALEQWERRQEEPLGLDKSLELYGHYLNGRDVEDIFHYYNGKIPFGQIVDSKIRYEWDKRKKTQLSSLFKKVEEKIIKTKADTVFYLSDILEASHKFNGKKIKLYLETGDEAVLGSLDLSNVKTYKTILELFDMISQKSEAQVDSKEVNVTGAVTHQHNVKVKATDAEAAKLLKMFDNGEIVDVIPNTSNDE